MQFNGRIREGCTTAHRPVLARFKTSAMYPNQGTKGLKYCLFYRRMCVCVCGLYMKYMLNNSILLLLLLLLYLTEDGRYINFGDSGL